MSAARFAAAWSALDAETGRRIWKTYSVPDPPKAYKKNSAGTQLYGPAGAAIWSSPTIDEKRKRVYVGHRRFVHRHRHSNQRLDPRFRSRDRQHARGSSQVTPKRQLDASAAQGPELPRRSRARTSISAAVDVADASAEESRFWWQRKSRASSADSIPDQRGKIVWQTSVGAGGAQGGIQWGPGPDDQNTYAAVSDLDKCDKDPQPGM